MVINFINTPTKKKYIKYKKHLEYIKFRIYNKDAEERKKDKTKNHP